MGSDCIPDPLSSESQVCAHMHSITRTQEILTSMSKMGECQQQKHTVCTVDEGVV